ncbi:MAG: hypothetical protein L0H79_04815 [Intrasporangium sp.]|uniref:hypothetical protein n=1 Tax=Intrasporangium sp. TaxID=1925024 RepID=UPI002649552F|nr:hypothetical protein [Intrasporangium sp.]MDN5795056.1 hypothetical protein [Intrasporangium sp.]
MAQTRAPLGTSTEQAVHDLFETRIEGLRRADLRRWLQGLRGPDLIARQQALFDRMRMLRVRDVRLMGVRSLGPAEDRASGWTRRMAVDLSYRLTGFDTAPRRFSLEVTVDGTTAGPHEIAGKSQVALIGSRPLDRPQPWDLPDLQVRAGPSVLVAVSGTPSRAEAIARQATVASRRVAGVLGGTRPAVVVVPDTDASAAYLLGRAPGRLDGVAAVTDGPLEQNGRAGADRVVLVPTAWSALSTAGREVVLAHELTHLTTRATAGRGVPLWLSEGLAEYVAYRDVRMPEPAIVRPALEQARRAGMPTHWPSDAQFAPDSGTLSASYGLALLACRTIAGRHGQAGLLALYRTATDSGTMASAFRAVGTEEGTELIAWRRRVAELLRVTAQP